MKLTKYTTLTACGGLSVLLLAILYTRSGISQTGAQPFKRFFREIAEPSKVYDIKYNSYYIAGTTRDSIYLGNLTAPLHIIGIDNQSLDTQHIEIRTKTLPTLSLHSTRISVRDGFFYISDGANRTIIVGRTGEWRPQHTYIINEHFNDFEPIDSTFYAIGAYSLQRENILGTIRTGKNSIIEFEDQLLEKQIDGIFSTDGMLHYIPDLGHLIYVYYYRNQYILFDTALDLVTRCKTLDTTSFAQIRTHKLASSDTYTLKAPPVLVNKNTCVWRKFLLIDSPALAENENKNTFRLSSVIDVYNLQTQTYAFSFHISEFNRSKFKSFGASGNTLIALFDHYFIAYNITM